MRTLPFAAGRTGTAALETPVLQTGRLVIRPPRRGDEWAIVAYYQRNRAFLAPWEPEKPADFYTHTFWAEQIGVIRDEFKRQAAVRFFVFPADDPAKIVGYVSYTQIVQKAAWYCILGYSLSEELQGRGLMTEALLATNGWVFDYLHLHRIMANYMPHNHRSGSLLRRIGFVPEGFAREYLLINGKWEDHVLMSLTNPNWHRPE